MNDTEKCYLEIPPAHLAYAKQFGVERDLEGRYFFRGDPPPELHSYVIRKPRRKDYAAERPEQCPRCGAAMVLRTNRVDNGLFYGCSSFPLCKGQKRFE